MNKRELVHERFHELINAKQHRCTGKGALSFIRDKLPFRTPSMYGEWKYPYNDELPPVYVVYSYGEHFPMWLFEPVERVWFGVIDRTTITTAKQQATTNPGAAVWVYVSTLKGVITNGIDHEVNKILAGKG